MAPAHKASPPRNRKTKEASAAKLSKSATTPGVAKQKKQQAASANSNSKKKQTQWEKVQVADDLLLGSTEYGFMGLEEFTPEAGLILGPNLLHETEPAHEQPDTPAPEHAAPSSSGKHKNRAESSQPGAQIDSAAAAQASMLKEQGLEASASDQKVSKKKLRKCKSSKEPSASVSEASQQTISTADEPGAKRPKRAKNEKGGPLKSASKVPVSRVQGSTKKNSIDLPAGQKQVASSLQPSPEAAGLNEELHPNAWQPFELHASLEGALLAQGFSYPTPIQEACLMPAIRGRCDVIGAAQTVGIVLCCMKDAGAV